VFNKLREKIKNKIKPMSNSEDFVFAGTKYTHIKTNKIYYLFGALTNKTSGESDGAQLAFYTDGKRVYVRDDSEFLEKFKEN
jgi:hypothetical protein